MRGAKIDDNLMDIGRAFWSGQINWSPISNNVIENVSQTGVYITGSGLGMKVRGNQIGGMQEPKPSDDTIHQATKGIWFMANGTIIAADVSGNTLKQINQDGVLFSRALNDCVVSKNIIESYNLSANTDYAAIRVQNSSGLDNALSNCVVQGNTGSAPPVGDFFKIDSGAASSSIIANAR